MRKKAKLFIIFTLVLAFGLTVVGCDNGTTGTTETQFLVRAGGQRAGTGTFQTGVFVSPAGALVPHLIEDSRDIMTLPEIEAMLRQLNFNQSWIQSVRNNLNNSNSAFVFYVNVNSFFRWFWITRA